MTLSLWELSAVSSWTAKRDHAQRLKISKADGLSKDHVLVERLECPLSGQKGCTNKGRTNALELVQSRAQDALGYHFSTPQECRNKGTAGGLAQ